MTTTRLGKSDVEVARVVLGAMAPSLEETQEARAKVFHAAFDAGVTAVDTAPLYEFGGSETILGRVLRERAHPVTVMTKVGLRWDDDHGDVLFAGTVDGTHRVVRKDARPAAVRKDVDGSLSRLGLEVLDVVYVHHPDRHTPLDETLGALHELVQEGKVRAIGLSNHAPHEVERASRVLGPEVPLACVQQDYSLTSRWVEAELLPLCRDRGVGFLSYSPLDRGLVCGRGLLEALPAGDFRRSDPRFHRANLRRLRSAVLGTLAEVAAEYDVPSSVVALAWVLAQPGVSGVVVGARTAAQAATHGRALSLTLSDGDEARLRAAFEAARLDLSAGRGLAARAVGRGRRALGRGRRAVVQVLRRLRA